MGCTSEQRDCENDETQHSVTVSDFYIGKYEVTQAQWKKIMNSNPSKYRKGDKYPVENVSWNDVQDFIKKLKTKTGKNYRLPTEAEREYAARGGESYQYAGSNTLDEVAWSYNNSDGKTHEVGGKKQNGYGLYDMSGNVWEWCQDWYDSNYYKNSQSSNPVNTTESTDRVLRGGGWYDDPLYCRVANRSGGAPTYSLNGYGFRLVLSSQ
jgi:formylglycine-generating enzyme required for sulfatase activity